MNERTKWFNEARFGMFIHLGLYSILSYQEWCRTRDRISDKEYQSLLKRFNPDRYNPEKWAALAKRAGMKYSVFTAKHHDGFCLFDSKYTDFKVTNAQVKQDMIKGYLDAFRNCDLEAGLYYSLLDWNHPEYTIDRIHPHRNHPDWNLPLGENPEPHRDMAKYREYMFNQIEELLTNYGKIPLMWFDFSFDEKGPDDWDSESLSRLIRSRQPDIVLNSRLDRGHLIGKKTKYSGDFFTPEQFVPEQGYCDEKGNHLSWESCVTLNDNWCYVRDDQNFKSATQIIRLLVECVSKGGNLLLNVGPTSRGDIQEEAIRILEDVGDWMNLHSNSIYGCGNANLPKPGWGFWTQKEDKLFAHVINAPTGPIVLKDFYDKIEYATLLSDGSNINMPKPWMFADVHNNDAYLTMPVQRAINKHDTVIELKLKQQK